MKTQFALKDKSGNLLRAAASTKAENDEPFYSGRLRLFCHPRKTRYPIAAKTATNAKTINIWIATVRNPTKAMSCSTKKITRAISATTPPHFDVTAKSKGIIKLLPIMIAELTFAPTAKLGPCRIILFKVMVRPTKLRLT